jgi:hypothetical protein
MAKGVKDEKQFERTRLNKIKRIEKELKKHPMTMNNLKMIEHLEELKKGVNKK